MCLKGLDLASLIKMETVARTLPESLSSAFSDAWDAQEARVDPDETVEGATARDRVIGSCLPYRRHLMRQFVEKLWTTGPTDNETVLGMQALVSGNYDVYVAFSRPARGSCRRTFLAGDFVDQDDVEVGDDGLGALFPFDLSSSDLTNWPSLQQIASSDGDTFIQRFNNERGVLGGEIKEALGEFEATVVAIHRTTLSPSILFASDKNNATNGLFLDTHWYDAAAAAAVNGERLLFSLVPCCRRCRGIFCRAGSMDTNACDGAKKMRQMHFFVYGRGDMPSTVLDVLLMTVRQKTGRCWRPWWLSNRLIFFMLLCLVCVCNVKFWLNDDLHATHVGFF